jgi:hypothetical protein
VKSFLKALLIIAILLILALTTGAGLYWYNWQKNEPAKTIEVTATPLETKIGSPVDITILVQTPWYRSIDAPVTMGVTDNAAISEDIQITRKSTNLSGYLWEIKLKLLLFDKGIFKDMKIYTPLSADWQKKQKELVTDLPEIKATLNGIKESSSIALKSQLDESSLTPKKLEAEEKSKLWIWVLVASAVTAIGALLFLFMKKGTQKKVKIIPSWQLAQQALNTLKQELSLNDEVFFVRLTDILRLYIENRFSLQATESTSEEFIQEIRRDTILSEKQQVALENFLSTADLVKFARMAADAQKREECLFMADSFVKETIPQAETT